MRLYRDRDYLQTKEGYFFCVIDAIHPEDRVISYLKYVPDPLGIWGRDSIRFRRILPFYTIPDLLETLNFLKAHSEYIYDSKVLGIRISAVPVERVSKHLKPEEKISEFSQIDKLDSLQNKALRLIDAISEESLVPIRFFGVTGSLLLDIQRDFSDIDLVVYGIQNSLATKEALRRAYSEGNSLIRQLDKKRAKEWCLSKTQRYPLTYEEAMRIFERKWNRGLFDEAMFSIHPVKIEGEVTEKYGDKTFKHDGMVQIEATISEDSEADFLPSCCEISNVKVLSGTFADDIRQLTSYEGLYGGIAEKGERVTAYGKMEKVVDHRTDDHYHRIVIGSMEAKGKDYVKLL